MWDNPTSLTIAANNAPQFLPNRTLGSIRAEISSCAWAALPTVDTISPRRASCGRGSTRTLNKCGHRFGHLLKDGGPFVKVLDSARRKPVNAARRAAPIHIPLGYDVSIVLQSSQQSRQAPVTSTAAEATVRFQQLGPPALLRNRTMIHARVRISRSRPQPTPRGTPTKAGPASARVGRAASLRRISQRPSLHPQRRQPYMGERLQAKADPLASHTCASEPFPIPSCLRRRLEAIPTRNAYGEPEARSPIQAAWSLTGDSSLFSRNHCAGSAFRRSTMRGKACRRDRRGCHPSALRALLISSS